MAARALLEVASVGTRRDLGTAGRSVERGAHKRHDVGGDLLASWPAGAWQAARSERGLTRRRRLTPEDGFHADGRRATGMVAAGAMLAHAPGRMFQRIVDGVSG